LRPEDATKRGRRAPIRVGSHGGCDYRKVVGVRITKRERNLCKLNYWMVGLS